MNADLMERLGVPLDSCHLYGWHNIISYARLLMNVQGSHTWRALHNQEDNYASPLHLAAQLADIYDLIQVLYISLTTKPKTSPRKMEPYPRPWKKSETRRIGKGAIKVKDFDSWYYGGD